MPKSDMQSRIPGPDGSETGQIPIGFNAELLNFKIVNDTTIEVQYRQESNMVYCEGGRPPASIWKDVYKVRKGKIVKDTTIYANVEPAHEVPEKIEWPK